jgi:hypothetical protein
MIFITSIYMFYETRSRLDYWITGSRINDGGGIENAGGWGYMIGFSRVLKCNRSFFQQFAFPMSAQ